MAGRVQVEVAHQLLCGVLGIVVQKRESATASQQHERAFGSLKDGNCFESAHEPHRQPPRRRRPKAGATTRIFRVLELDMPNGDQGPRTTTLVSTRLA